MIRPRVLAHRYAEGVVVIGPHASFLLAKADIVVVERVSIRSPGFEHEIVTVIKSQAVDQHVSTLVAVAVEAFDGAGLVASERYTTIGVMNTLATATGTVAA